MKATVQIISERDASYQGKRGRVEQILLACLDLCPVSPMLNTFDYLITEEERKRYPAGTLCGKKIQLAFTEAKPDFAGRLRFLGSIIEEGSHSNKS